MQVAIVTGATSGIGLGCAKKLAEMGMAILGTGRDEGRLGELEAATQRFVSAFWSSDLSATVKEAALFNLSTLRSQTYFRTADGYPFGWEGCLDEAGSCLGSCTHVWNYDLATGYLFGSLARQMRELEYQ